MGKGLFAVAVAAAVFAVAGPAQATVQDHEHYAMPYSDDFTECGFSIHVEGFTSGNARNRVGKGDLDTAYFSLNNYAYSETWTNTANDRFFTIWGDANIKDVTAKRISGSVFQFTTVESGRPFNLVDANGQVLVRDRGAIRETYTFDTGGDHELGGTYLEQIALRVSGPHPGFFPSEEAFCAVITPLLN